MSNMNKKHWNTVLFESDVPDDEIVNLLNLSYEIVFKTLTKKLQKEINENELFKFSNYGVSISSNNTKNYVVII